MKNSKHGLTLAEVLISLAIMAVVAAMGITIANKGIERAYNLYFYTGYDGLYKALEDTARLNLKLCDGPFNSANDANTVETSINAAAINHIADVLNIPNDAQHRINNNPANGVQLVKLIAPNNIEFSILHGIHANDHLLYENTDGKLYRYYVITMKVPSRKVRQNGADIPTTTAFGYFPDISGGILFPISNNIYFEPQPGLNNNITPNHTFVDLSTRPDLLPFYVNNGVNGRIRFSINADGSRNNQPLNYVPRTFMSSHDALCRIYGPFNVNTNTTFSNATIGTGECNAAAGVVNGVLAYENPKKAY